MTATSNVQYLKAVSRAERKNSNNSSTSIDRFISELEIESEHYSSNRPPLCCRDMKVEEGIALEPCFLSLKDETINNQPQPTATATEENGTNWYNKNTLVRTNVNCPNNIREYSVCSQIGNIYRRSCYNNKNNNKQVFRLDDFLIIPPQIPQQHVCSQIGNIYRRSCYNNKQVLRLDDFLIIPPQIPQQHSTTHNSRDGEKSNMKSTRTEIRKFFGFIFLATSFKFKSRASLWSTTLPSRHKDATAFGQTGISHQRLNNFLMCILFSNQARVS